MNKIPRGYTITPKVKYFRTKDGKKRTNVVELVHKRKGIKKLFGNEEWALALNLSGFQHVKGVVAAHKDSVAAVEFTEIVNG
jgi:hypothetical protein